MFFLRHLVNMSFMFPFWASTGSGSVPIWEGPRPKPRHPEDVVYSLNDSCSHFTQRLFPPKVPQQQTEIIPMVHNNIIHTYYTSHSHAHLHLLFYMSYSKPHFFRSSWQAGCPLHIKQWQMNA
jgi:hypothetical protein